LALTPLPDDVRDMYRRAVGEELKVEGLREDQQLAQE
jgi:Rab GDP dissociation inhibitor